MVPVSRVTGFPEILGGRVKTLHPKIHGGILANRHRSADAAELSQHGITPIDLVVVNLYPFRETAARGAKFAAVIESIDIGGPCMVRAAAKNFQSVAVVVDPEDYPQVLTALEKTGEVPESLRRKLAVKAFRHTQGYDAAIAEWLERGSDPRAADGGEAGPRFPRHLYLDLERDLEPRYGENPHQPAAVYRTLRRSGGARRPGAAPGQGAVVQQPARRRRRPPGGGAVRRAGGGDRQAQQPVRRGARRRPRRGLRAGAGHRPGVGLRLGGGAQPAGRPDAGRADGGAVRGGGGGAGGHRRGAGGVRRQAEPAGPGLPALPAPPVGDRAAGDRRRLPGAGARRRARRPRRLGLPHHPAAERRGAAGARLRLGRSPATSSRTPSCSPPASRRWGWAPGR